MKGRRPTAPGNELAVSTPAVSTPVVAIAGLGLSALMAGAVLAAAGGADRTPGRVALHVLVVAAPVATGLYALRSPRSARFGRLLIASALIWSLAVLAEADGSLPYSVGRVAAWTIFPTLVYLMLTFPEGRLRGRRDRLLFGAVTGVILVLYLGSVPFVEAYPSASPWTRCGADCPGNAFLVLASQPGFIGSVVEPLRDALSVLLLIGVTASLALRLRAGGAMRRPTTAPVVAVSIAATLLLVAFIVARRIAPDAGAARGIGLAWALCLPAIAAAFSAGLLQRRLLVGRALSGLSHGLGNPLELVRLGAALRATVGDPGVDVLVHDGGRWLHDDGLVADRAEMPGPGRSIRIVYDDGGPVLAILLDAELDPDDELIEAIASLAEAALREGRLKADLQVSLDDLEDSRKRIATAADVERRRIERDLHDGAQQRLIALRMRLSLAEDLMSGDAPAAEAIRDLGHDVDLTLEDIRSLAHGIYPALLADRGLADALRSAARRWSLRIDLHADGMTRHPAEIESAVYFSCLEALQNVAKHAGPVKNITILLHQDGVLAFEVTDDGQGFSAAGRPGGVGLRNMRDRVESLGGTLVVESVPGDGTTVRGVVPLPAVRALDAPEGSAQDSADSSTTTVRAMRS